MANLQVSSSLSSTPQYASDGTNSSPLALTNSATGKVGIGTTTLGAPLTFGNDLGDKIAFWAGAYGAYGIGCQNYLLQIYCERDISDIAFGYGSSGSFTELMRIHGSGAVTIENGTLGIGTSSPSCPLHIKSLGTPNSGMYRSVGIGNDASGGTILFIGRGADTNSWNGLQAVSAQGTSWGDIILNPSGGNVGIGTTSPGQKLEVAGNVKLTGSSGVILPQLTSAPTAVDGMIAYADGTSWNPGSGKGIYAYYNSTWNKL